MNISSGTWLWGLFAALSSTIYFFLMKEFLNRKKWWIVGLAIILELITLWLYYQSLKGGYSGIIYSIINGMSVLFGVGIAVLIFREKLSWTEYMGIFLIVSGLLLVGQKKHG